MKGIHRKPARSSTLCNWQDGALSLSLTPLPRQSLRQASFMDFGGGGGWRRTSTNVPEAEYRTDVGCPWGGKHRTSQYTPSVTRHTNSRNSTPVC